MSAIRRRMEKAIAAADSGSIRQRWEYGRLLLVDDTTTTPAGNLRNGAMAGLVADARKVGCKLSRREIQRRLQCGNAYPTEAQLRQILAQYRNWWQLIKAGFPAVEPLDGAEPYDPRSAAERARDASRVLAGNGPGDDGQLALFDYFPSDAFDEFSTLAELDKHTEEMAEWTARHARKDRERRAYVDRLISAVSGDMSKTWAEAQAAVDAAA